MLTRDLSKLSIPVVPSVNTRQGVSINNIGPTRLVH